MRLPRSLVALACACVIVGLLKSAEASDWRYRDRPNPLLGCKGDCAIMIFAGVAIGTGVQDIFFNSIPSWSWQYEDSGIVGGTLSRRITTIFRVFDLEAEIGAAQRFGSMDQTEFWEALYLRYGEFPWNSFLHTTVAVSTGLNYASGISQFEKDNAGPVQPNGANVLHYFAPEVTFAWPDRLDRQLVLRLHHRSGAYGVLNEVYSGTTYLTVGLRSWF